MKYTEIEKTSSKVILDYVTPKWYYPLLASLFAMCIGAIVFVSLNGNGKWYMNVLLMMGFFFVYLNFSQYTKKRPIVIDYVSSTIAVDDIEKSFSDISDIVAYKYNDRSKSGLSDANAPGIVSSKQRYTTFETYIVFNDNTGIRVYFGTMKGSLAEEERFRKYCNM